MIASIGENRKRPKGKIIEEPPVILCTTEELNHVLDNWIGYEIVKPYPVSRPPIEEEKKNPLFTGFITMSSMPPRNVGPFRGSFTKSYERKP